MIINYSPVTKSKVEAIPTARCAYRLYNTSAYSICAGVVVYVGQQHPNSEYSVVIQFNATRAVMYSALSTVAVGLNDVVAAGDLIGTSRRCFTFSCLFSSPQTSYPVMVQHSVYYKVDALPWVDGSQSFPSTRDPLSYTGSEYVEPDLSGLADAEFADGR